MTKKRFHTEDRARRRGETLPERLCISARRGVTLVELMISMLILAIVCLSWLQIIGIQSAKREARRREAVERLSGMMDAFLYFFRTGMGETGIWLDYTGYKMVTKQDRGVLYFENTDSQDVVHQMFENDVSPIGYQLFVVPRQDLPNSVSFKGWSSGYWLVGRLYDGHGSVDDLGKPFFTLPVSMGFPE